jgi:protein SCO1/2
MYPISHKICRWSIVILLAMGLSAYLGFYHSHSASHPIKIDGVYLTTPSDIPNFHLTDNNNHVFSKESLKHHWTFLFFGFTNCGYVCPVTLTELNKMMVLLKKKLSTSDIPQIVFISVDPERDTVERLNGYLGTFNPQFIGLHGGEAETDALEKKLHIVAAKMESTQGNPKKNYTIDHTAEILLINPDAKLQAYLSYPHQAEHMAKDYQKILTAA